MKQRVLIGVVLVIGLLVAVVGVVYAFGTPEQVSVPAETLAAAPVGEPVTSVAGSAGDSPGSSMADSVGTVAEGAEAPEPDPSSPLAIEIPGCVCHSDDPKLVKEHEAYRMNQCAGCHVGQVPTGQ